MRRRNALGSLLCLLCHACLAAELPTNADFAAPAGLALAGPNFAYAFVANTGAAALQVVEVNKGLARTDMVAAPARFVPLYVPVGASPTAVAASADGAYVFVLDAASASLRAVDANVLRLLRDPAGAPLTLPLPPASTPTALVTLPGACVSDLPEKQCRARLFVALRDAAAVAVIDLLQDAAGAWQWRQRPNLLTGGAPQRLAVHPRGSSLFATDALAGDLLRLDLGAAGLQPAGVAPVAGAAAVERFALGEPGALDPAVGDALAVGAGGSVVAVARPRWRDVVLLAAVGGADVASGALAPVAPNSPLAPPPRCLAACGAPPSASCTASHPADQSLCVQQDASGANVGLGAATPYRAVYVDTVPTQIVALTGAIGAPLPLAPPASERAFSEAIAVAGLDGRVALIGTHDANGLLAPAYVEAGPRPAVLGVEGLPPQQAPDLLAPCPSHPAQRRHLCLSPDPSLAGLGEVLWQRRGARSHRWSLDWEGVLPQTIYGSGLLQADGSFLDLMAAEALSGAGIVAAADAAALKLTPAYQGDVLEVLPGELAAACRSLGGCPTERRIAAVRQEGAALRYLLDPPLDPACFTGATLAYRVRAGGAHLVIDLDPDTTTPPQRLPLGATYGLQNAAQAASGLIFTSRALPPPAPVCGAVSAAAAQAPLARGRPHLYTLDDPFAAPHAGLGPVGFVPGGMLMTRTPQPTLLLSFTGSNALMALDPTQATGSNAGSGAVKILH